MMKRRNRYSIIESDEGESDLLSDSGSVFEELESKFNSGSSWKGKQSLCSRSASSFYSKRSNKPGNGSGKAANCLTPSRPHNE